MRKAHVHVLAAALMLAAIGCGGSSAKPAQSPASGEQVSGTAAERVVSLFEALADSISGQDCAGWATQVNGWVDRNGPDVGGWIDDSESADMDASKAATLDARLKSALNAIMAGAGQCNTHADARAALARLDGVIGG